MSRYENDNLILTPEESRRLIKNLLNPEKDNFVKRNEFLNSFEELDVIETEDGTVFIDIPELVFDEHIPSIEVEEKKSYIEVRYYSGEVKKFMANNIKYNTRLEENDKYYNVELSNAAVA